MKPNKILLSAVLVLAHTFAAHAESLTIMDDRGEPVTVSQKAERIAAVSLFGADLAIALGVKPVATTYLTKDTLPAFLSPELTDVPKLGSRGAPNMEVLTQQEPDLIVALRRYSEGYADDFNAIAPYQAVHTESFADSLDAVSKVSYLMGRKEDGAALNEQFLDDIYTMNEKITDEMRGKTFLFLWGSGTAPWAYYDDYATVAFLNALGLKNPIGSNPLPHDRNNFAYEMNLEQMLVIDPDYLVVFDRGPDQPFLSNPIWSELKAVKNDKVIFVGDHWMASHGPIARQLILREAAHMFYPDLFESTDVVAVKTHVAAAWSK